MFFRVEAKFWGVAGRLFERDDDGVDVDEEQLMVALGGGTDVPEPDGGCGEDCCGGCAKPDARFGFRPPKRGVTRA